MWTTSPSVHRSWRRRGRRLVIGAGAVVVAGATVFAGGTAAQAKGGGGLPSSLAMFAHCPVGVKGVATCLYSSTTSTTFDIGSTTVTSSSPTTISLGLMYTKAGDPIVVLPVDGSQALTASPIPLPGGLTGISGVGGSGPTAVTVTPQLVGLPTANLAALLGANGTGLSLPLDVLISTPSGVLGKNCTIGGADSPMTLNLTTGTTDPPAPNTPISGSVGTIVSTPLGTLTDTGLTLVDNAFAVPVVENCGTGGILDEILDLDKSLPSAAGKNTAILQGASYTAPAKLVKKYLRRHPAS